MLQVITLDMGLLVAGTKYRGEFEERLKKLMEEIKQNDDIILVSFNIHPRLQHTLCVELPSCLFEPLATSKGLVFGLLFGSSHWVKSLVRLICLDNFQASCWLC